MTSRPQARPGARVRLAWFAVAILALAGCAQQPPRPAVSDAHRAWEHRQQQLSQLVHWDLFGRIGVKNGNDAWQGSLSWQQAPKGYTIEVDGPFGQSQFQLNGGPAGVTLRTANRQQHWASDPEELLYEQTGLQMPVSGLRYWVLGLPAPAAQAGPASDRQLDAQGRLTRFVQGGWEVRIRSYTEVGRFDLPAKVFIRRDDLDLRLVVDRWRLHTPQGLQTSRPYSFARLAAAGVRGR